MQERMSVFVSHARGLVCTGFFAAAIASIAGCSITATENLVNYAELALPNSTPAQALSGVTSALVNQGYDVKLTDKDAGVVISEYRLVARKEGNPPFDIYLQLRTTIREASGKTTLRVTPACRSQNRLNPAAFSEIPLVYYTGEAKDVQGFVRSAEVGWWWKGAYEAFERVLANIAYEAKVPGSEVRQDVTSRTVSK